MLPNLLFGLFLIALAGSMLIYHVRAHRRALGEDPNEKSIRFALRQYRRRLQVCMLLAIVGGAIIGGIWMTDPKLAAGYWFCVVALVFWMAALALFDLLVTRAHLRATREEYDVEHAALRAELAKYLPDAKHPRPESNSRDH